MKRERILVGAAALVLAAMTGSAEAGGGGGGHGVCAGFAESGTILMRDSCFEGTAHFVPAGSTVTVVNEGEAPHSLTAVDDSFDTGTLQPGEEAEFVLDETGVVRIYCRLHGTVDGSGTSPLTIRFITPNSLSPSNSRTIVVHS